LRVRIEKLETTDSGEPRFGVFLSDLSSEEALKAKNERMTRFMWSLNDFHNRAPGLSTTEKMEWLLRMGCERFNMGIGLINYLNGEQQITEFGISVVPEIYEGLEIPEGESYCRITAAQEDGLFHINRAGETDFKKDPAYEALGLECYLGGVVQSEDGRHRTICFADVIERDHDFTDADTASLELLIDEMQKTLDVSLSERYSEDITD
jgi:hypothetical protein